MNLAFTLSKLLDASHSLKDKLAEKHIKRPNGKAIGQQACTELLCQALFSKPYGEVKDMLEKASDSSQESSNMPIQGTLSADDIEAIFDKQPVYSATTGQQLTFLSHGDNALLMAKNINTKEDYTMDTHSLHGELDGDELTLIDDDSTVELTLKP